MSSLWIGLGFRILHPVSPLVSSSPGGGGRRNLRIFDHICRFLQIYMLFHFKSNKNVCFAAVMYGLALASVTVPPPTPDRFAIGCLLLSGLASVPSRCNHRPTPLVIPNRTILVVTEKSLNGWIYMALLSNCQSKRRKHRRIPCFYSIFRRRNALTQILPDRRPFSYANDFQTTRSKLSRSIFDSKMNADGAISKL